MFPLERRHLKKWAAISVLWAALAAHAQGFYTPTSQKPNNNSQGQTTDNSVKYTLSGSVLNSLTGEPVVRALVQMLGPESRAAFTDRDGNFRFSNLSAGPGMVMAFKPGFYREGDNPMGMRAGGRTSMFAIGPNMQPVAIKLVPEAAIRGQITDENGEPLEGVRVGIFTSVIQNGRKHVQQMPTQQTDDNGQYDLSNLQTGAYTLYAGPVWSNATGDGADSYGQTFYPGVEGAEESQAIQLAPGQTVRADIALQSAKTFRISGVVSGSPPGYPQVFNKAGDVAGGTDQFDPNTGRFAARVACTVCVIKARGGNRRGSAYGETVITVNGDRSDIQVQMTDLTIPVTTQFERTKPDTTQDAPTSGISLGKRMVGMNSSVMLRLSSLSRLHPDAYTNMVGCPEHCEPEIQNLEFGKYVVEPLSQGWGWYVKSLTYGGTDLGSEPLEIQGASSQPIEVVLRDDGATLTAVAQGDWDQNSPVGIVVVADRAPLRVQFYSTTSGTITMQNLAPGDYKIYAFDNANGLEYQNPEALREYSGQAATVTLQPNGKSSVNVRVIRRPQ